MTLTINNTEIEFDNETVKSCRNRVAELIENVRDISLKNNKPDYYFTYLLVMHIMSQSVLNEIEPGVLAKAMECFNIHE